MGFLLAPPEKSPIHDSPRYPGVPPISDYRPRMGDIRSFFRSNNGSGTADRRRTLEEIAVCVREEMERESAAAEGTLSSALCGHR